MDKVFEALERLAMPDELHIKECKRLGIGLTEDYELIKQRLEAIDNVKPSEALFYLIDYIKFDTCYNKDFLIKKIDTIKQALLKAQELEKENEILKEIIKSLFDRGCPLHQYNDRRFGLTIEVDKEISIMHLGEFKGIDLDKKLKEILE